jgi:hypothetical protein
MKQVKVKANRSQFDVVLAATGEVIEGGFFSRAAAQACADDLNGLLEKEGK